jgi:K+-sensing histidine kinase KdpD
VNDKIEITNSLDRMRLKYEALRDVAVSAAEGADLEQICTQALEAAVRIVGVMAGAVTLYDSKGKPTQKYFSGADEYVPLMQELQQKLIAVLRLDFSVENMFLTLNRDGKQSLFSYPLVIGGKNLGTISGVTPGERNLSAEEEFIEGISSQLALALSIGGDGGASVPDLKKAKADAVVETAVTINHEINNPLTAVLGNTQLLLVDRDKLDARTIKMLEGIETAALRIKEVTGKLMRMVEPKITEYTNGINMVDIDGSSTEENE